MRAPDRRLAFTRLHASGAAVLPLSYVRGSPGALRKPRMGTCPQASVYPLLRLLYILDLSLATFNSPDNMPARSFTRERSWRKLPISPTFWKTPTHLRQNQERLNYMTIRDVQIFFRRLCGGCCILSRPLRISWQWLCRGRPCVLDAIAGHIRDTLCVRGLLCACLLHPTGWLLIPVRV